MEQRTEATTEGLETEQLSGERADATTPPEAGTGGGSDDDESWDEPDTNEEALSHGSP